MNTYITLGKVTVSFRDESGTLCSIRRADRYKREKPKGWGEEDFYVVTHEDGEVYANFAGDGTIEVNGEIYGILPINKMPLKKSSNKIVVHSAGKSYTITLHLVMARQQESAESKSKGITYNAAEEMWIFDEITGFFESLFWLWSDSHQDDYAEEFSVEGYREGEQEELGAEQENQEMPAGQEDLSLQGQAESEPSVAERVEQEPAYTAPEPTHHYSPPEPTHYSAPEPSHHSSYDHSSHSDHSSSYDSGSSSDSGGGCDGGGCDGGGGGGD